MDPTPRATNGSCHAVPDLEVVVEVVVECASVGKWVEEAQPPMPPPEEEAAPPTLPPGEMLLGRERTGEVLQVSLGGKGQERCHGGGREWERIGEVRETANPNSWYRYKPS